MSYDVWTGAIHLIMEVSGISLEEADWYSRQRRIPPGFEEAAKDEIMNDRYLLLGRADSDRFERVKGWSGRPASQHRRHLQSIIRPIQGWEPPLENDGEERN